MHPVLIPQVCMRTALVTDGDGDGGMELGAALEDMLVGSEGSGASDDMDDSSGEQSDDEEEDDDDVSASSGDLQACERTYIVDET